MFNLIQLSPFNSSKATCMDTQSHIHTNRPIYSVKITLRTQGLVLVELTVFPGHQYSMQQIRI